MTAVTPRIDSTLLNDSFDRSGAKLDLILRTISEYSPSGNESGVAKILFDYLNKRKLFPRIDTVGNVICEFGSGEKSLLLCGHMDTVPGNLKVKMENGRIFGRGACDAKGPLLSLLFAFENLAAQSVEEFDGKVIFAGVTDEEQSSAGLSELIRNGVRADYALFGEPGGLSRITVGYRGHVTLHLTIVTPEIHASAPKLVTNSAELLYEIYSSLKQVLDAQNNESLDRISISLTEIRSGTAHNVIPGKTTATIDIRVPIGSRTAQVKESVRKLIDDFESKTEDAEIFVSYDEPTEPYRVSLNSPLVRALSRSILKSGSKPQFITKSGTGDMNTYAQVFGVDTVTYGPGEAKLSHTSEENVSIQEILGCADVLSKTVNELIAVNQVNSANKEDSR